MVGKKTTMVLSTVTETIGSQGETVQSWADLEYLIGSLKSVSGKEQFVDGKWRINSDFTFYVEPSKKNTITEKFKLRIPSEQREFDIVKVNNMVEQGIYLKLDLLERT
jgi:head-tail adaptor